MSNFLPAKRGFNMACWNINSLVKHVDELRVLLGEFSYDSLAINETKLDEVMKSSGHHIPGYEFISHDRNRHGGGVGFYIKSLNSYIVRNVIWKNFRITPHINYALCLIRYVPTLFSKAMANSPEYCIYTSVMNTYCVN